MDGTMSSSLRNEPNLTHGEQRILALLEAWGPRLERLEQGQQRLEQRLERVEQRLDSLEHRVESLDQRIDVLEKRTTSLAEELRLLTRRVEIEGAASKQRHRQSTEALLHFRKEEHERQNQLRNTWFNELHVFRTQVEERFEQHNTRLEMLEQAVQRLGDQLTQALQRQWAPLPTA